MKVVIIGGGAMGSLLAAKLTPHAEVWLVSGWRAHVEAIRRDGLRLTETDGSTRTLTVRVVTPPIEGGGDADLALIAVKARQTEEAAHRAAALLKPDGLALSLQNGLGNVERIAAVLGTERAVQGVTAHGATMVAPGHVRHAGAGPTHMATRPAIARQMEGVRALFEAAGFETRLSGNLDSVVWGKLVVNAGINALTAILGVPNGALVERAGARQAMEAAVVEAAAVARAAGIALPYEDPVRRAREVARATASNRSSMWADVLRGVPTEIDAINGAVVRAGRRFGVPAPVNQMLVWLVQAVEAGYSVSSAKKSG
ncbi:MAG: 2-dehydropantoate 2-reductase [Caldilineae bacterium]|nr:MAG: 2-dehydropantoate 2-reductase [Caldilineae bacterium]